jgi:hypothetical protein
VLPINDQEHDRQFQVRTVVSRPDDETATFEMVAARREARRSVDAPQIHDHAQSVDPFVAT